MAMAGVGKLKMGSTYENLSTGIEFRVCIEVVILVS